MKKIFLMLSFALLFVVKTFGQAAVDIPLSATDGTETYELAIGLDLTATNCIDPQLGESDINWGPPTNFFKFTFDLSPYGCPTGTNSLKDYRAPGNPPAFPFTGLVEHTLWWQTSAPALPIDINYNLPPGALMRIIDQIGGTYLNLGPFSGQGTATIPCSYTALFVRAYLIMEYYSIVPVELTSFTTSVLQNEKAVQLNWTTATETNNSGFEILRFAQNDNEWETIGFVPGFGTTTEPKSYSFTDDLSLTPNLTLTHTLRYRLKQIDFDGTSTYSNEIEVAVDFLPKEFVLYQNYPNPFNPNTIISWQSPVSSHQTLKIYDVLGNEVVTLVDEYRPAGKYEVEFNPETSINYPASGVYFYQLKVTEPESSSGQGFISIKKMILLR